MLPFRPGSSTSSWRPARPDLAAPHSAHPPGRGGAGLQVYYPGRGLTALELDTLTDYFRELEFFSFDRARP